MSSPFDRLLSAAAAGATLALALLGGLLEFVALWRAARKRA